MSKSKIATKTVLENGDVEFAFANQESRVVSLNDFSDSIKAKLIGYGISQKFGDTYASCGGDVVEALSMFDSVIEKLTGEDATWITKRAGGGSAKNPTLILEAISRYKDCSIEDASEIVESLDEEQLKAVRITPQIQLILNEIKAERAKAKADTATEASSEALSLI